MNDDYYSILGVNKTASIDEIKKAYRKKAMKCHPDHQAGKSDSEKKQAEEEFKQLSEAYEVLSDSEKRSIYDQYGKDGLKGGGPGNSGGFDIRDFMRRHGGIFSDLFGNMGGSPFGFGGFNQERGFSQRDLKENGRDVLVSMHVPLKDIVFGSSKSFKVSVDIECPKCHGTGGKNGEKPQTCQTCGGSGMITETRRQGMMMFSSSRPCHHCNGSGFTVKEICPECNGNKRTRIHKIVKITIPKGIENNTRLKIAGYGEAGLNGGTNGDLYINVLVDEHVFTRISKNDLAVPCIIDPITAIVGGEIEIPTPSGYTKISIPPNVKENQDIHVKNHGINGGVLHAIIKISTIDNMTESTRNQLRNILSNNKFMISEYDSQKHEFEKHYETDEKHQTKNVNNFIPEGNPTE